MKTNAQVAQAAQFKVEVIADSKGQWTGNAMAYGTFEEAKAAAVDLAYRWLSVRQARVVEFIDAPGSLESKIINVTIVFGSES